jgi:hypothetical protein
MQRLAWYSMSLPRNLYDIVAVEGTKLHLKATTRNYKMDKYFGSTSMASSNDENEIMRGLAALGEVAQDHGVSSIFHSFLYGESSLCIKIMTSFIIIIITHTGFSSDNTPHSRLASRAYRP